MSSRGRARGRAAPAAAGGAPSGSQPPRRPGEAGPSASAWGRQQPGQGAPAQAPRPQGAWGPPQQQQQQQQRPQQAAGAGRAPAQLQRAAASGGDGAAQVAQQMGQMSIGGGGPTGDGGRSVGRGNMRGGRNISEQVVRTRPDNVVTKKGTAGNPVNFVSNYFRFMAKPDWCLYQYRVDFKPEEDRTMIRRALMRVHKEKLGAYIFDGTVMFIARKLSNNVEEKVTFVSKRQHDDQIIEITCKYVGDIMPGNPQYLQFFNLMLRTFIGNLELQMVKRDFFDAKNKIEVPQHRLELWPGYQTSIRQHESEVLLCAEVTHKVMRMETCLDILRQCTRSGGDYKALFAKAVVGTVVLTDYNNRTYRVDDVNWSVTPAHTFKKGNEDVSYVAYMKQKYNLDIRDKGQPMLVSKSKPREVRAGQSDIVYLIPEVCRCTGITDAIKSDFKTMQDLAKHTRLTPGSRIDALCRFIRRLIDEPRNREGMKSWGMNMADSLTQVPGRVLPEELITFGQSRSTPACADWMKGMRNSPYVHTVPLKEWAVVFPSRAGRETEAFVRQLQQCGRGMSFNVPEPIVLEMRDDNAATYVQQLNQLLDRNRPQIVLCIVQGNKPDRYNAIKKVCYIDRGVPSQVVTSRVATKGMSVATKVILQMACKIGCIPWSVANPAKGMMVVGFDVCHDSTRKELSFGAMVASTNDTFGSYFSCVSEHKHGQELSNNFATNILKAVHAWEKQNGSKPSRIVIYRDGVGDGDLAYVHEHEVAMIKAKLAEAYGPAGVKFAFVVVNKRIKTRYFLGDRNPEPGSVVDDVITQPERYDFYLVSQYVGQGSVSPTSYNIIDDSSGFKPDHFQRLTYKLTHMYYNWPGPVRVPAPCQYAHKLAFLVGQTLHRSTSSELETTLYYL